MRIKKIKSGFQLPVLGLGTWGTGGRAERDTAADDGKLAAVIRAAIEAGFTRIDTAEMYAAGHSEELVGRAIRGFPREKLFLTSKVWKTHLHRADLELACENSLRRLGVEYLDLYLIHQVAPEVPVEESVEALNHLHRRGLIRNIGVSNFSISRLEEVRNFSTAQVVLNQLHYSLVVREAEAAGLPAYCREHDMIFEAWRPLRDLPSDCPLLREIADRFGMTPMQIALSFVLSQENMTAVTAMRNPAHFAENLAAAEFILPAEEIERLRREFPGQQLISPAVPLI